MPLIQSASKKALSKNVETEMKANPSPEKRKQNIAIAYSVKRQAMKKKKMASGGDVTANDESESSNSIDAASTKRDMAMAMGARPSMADEGDEEGKESMSGNSIDASSDPREMLMMKKRQMLALGGEITALEESMSGNSIDSAGDSREMGMKDSKPMRHKDELLARDIGHPGEDSEDEMEMDMLHTSNQPDSYSKDGVINYARGGSVADKIMKKKMMADGGEVDLQDNADEHLNEEDDMSYDAARKKTYFDDSQISEQPEDSNEHGDSEEADSENEHDMISKIRSKMKSKKMI